MDYSSLNKILFSVLGAAAFGLSASFICIIIQTVVYTIENLIFLPKRVFVSSRSSEALKNVKSINFPISSFRKSAKLFAGDFIFVLLYGIGSVFLLYITCDGAFRLYPLIISVSVSVISLKYFGKRLQSLTERFFAFLFLCITVLISVPTLIVRKNVFLAVKFCKLVYCGLINSFMAKKSRKIKKI